MKIFKIINGSLLNDLVDGKKILPNEETGVSHWAVGLDGLAFWLSHLNYSYLKRGEIFIVENNITI